MAMRADFYGVCATFPGSCGAPPANQALVGPMSRADLRKVIEEPAAAAGLRLEDGLVDTVLQDAGHRRRRAPAGLARDGRDVAAPRRPRRSRCGVPRCGRRGRVDLPDRRHPLRVRDGRGGAGGVPPPDAAARRPGRGHVGHPAPAAPRSELGRDPEPEVSTRGGRRDGRRPAAHGRPRLDRDRARGALAQLAAATGAGSTRRATTCARASVSITPRRSGSPRIATPTCCTGARRCTRPREWASEHGDALGPDEQAFLAASVEADERERARVEEGGAPVPSAATASPSRCWRCSPSRRSSPR